MKQKLCRMIFVGLLLIFDCSMSAYIQKAAEDKIIYDKEEVFQKIRDQEIAPEQVLLLKEYAKEDENDFIQYLLAYYVLDSMEEKELKNCCQELQHLSKADIEKETAYLESIWRDIRYFPVPASDIDSEKTVSFGDTWMQSRTYGGNRGHEGCDIMAALNQRGNYPVVSISDGTVEQMGWLELGGYRIGIRSPHGAYFYYAHLSDYMEGLSIGDEVRAGEVIAFMGDTGYSKTEGTTGNFDVHLHLGIYLEDENDQEFSVNSYSVLQYLYQQKQILYYQY